MSSHNESAEKILSFLKHLVCPRKKFISLTPVYKTSGLWFGSIGSTDARNVLVDEIFAICWTFFGAVAWSNSLAARNIFCYFEVLSHNVTRNVWSNWSKVLLRFKNKLVNEFDLNRLENILLSVCFVQQPARHWILLRFWSARICCSGEIKRGNFQS